MILIEYIYAFIGLLVIGYWLFVICDRLPMPDARCPIPYSLFPVLYWLLIWRNSRFGFADRH